MFAVVDIAGQQFKVQADQKLYVHRLQGNVGDEVSFDKVLLLDDAGQVRVGTPTVASAQVKATILDHLKGDKVIVFKKHRRTGYQVKKGHRQYLTQVQIKEIVA
jgi:ribosomal protein L21